MKMEESQEDCESDIRDCLTNRKKCVKYVVQNIFLVSSLAAVALGKFKTLAAVVGELTNMSTSLV